MEPRPVKYQISVTARASFNGTNYPDMVLAIDGVTVGSALVQSNNPVDYAFSADLTAGVAHTVSILYPNPTSSGELLDTDWHPHVAAIIQVERQVYTRNAKTGLLRHAAETAFYVANTPVTATHAAEAIRAHWRIENTSHYSRDVTLGEDRSRIRTNPGVFARLRSFAFNILKASQSAARAGHAHGL